MARCKPGEPQTQGTWYMVARCKPGERQTQDQTPAFHELLNGSNRASDLNTGTLLATLPGGRGSVLGLVGPVSVYCE